MSDRVELATAGGVVTYGEGADAVAPLATLLSGDGLWELEVGFGKGRFLLARATAEPALRFLGIEVAREYFRLAAGRLARRKLGNLALLRGEALALLATALPRAFASAVHVYFPDPWPKSRHQKRRLFAAESIDLLLGAVAPAGALYFATDHLEYGGEVRALLESYPGVTVAERAGRWPEGARTNYEAKFVAAGRPILRLEVRPAGALDLHPRGEREVLAAVGGSPSESTAIA
jgi:tRNA (guanine-N7-)-methyltransferase